MLARDRSVSTIQSGGEPTLIDAPPGAMFLTQIPGWVGRGVSAAQALARGGCLWTHCGVYVGDGSIVQAEPGGARVRRFDDCYRGREVLWSDAPIQRYLAELAPYDRAPDLSERAVRASVVDAALSLVDTPYDWLDYFAIGAAEWRWPGWNRLVDRTQTRGHLICSGLVDRTFGMAGIHLFSDGRPHGQVTPGDLARLDEAWLRRRLADLETRVRTIEEALR